MTKSYGPFNKILITCFLLSIHLIATGSVTKNLPEVINKTSLVLKQDFESIKRDGSNQLTLLINNETLLFELRPNLKLLGKNALNKATATGSQFELFEGEIVGKENTWARFTRKDGVLTGAFYDGQTLIFLRRYGEVISILGKNALTGVTTSNKVKLGSVVAIDIRNISHNGTCGLHKHEDNETFAYEHYVQSLKDVPAISMASVSQQINVNLFADTEYVDFHSSTGDKVQLAEQEMLSNLNIADGIFSNQLNITIVANDSIALADNEALTSIDPVDLLVAFRASSLPNPGLRHLFTGKDLGGPTVNTVGIAYVGSLCSSYSAGVTQRLGVLTPIVLTHELGHNFGAPHDNSTTEDSPICGATPSGFVMNPNVNGGGNTFSSCSVSQMEPVLANAANSNSCIVDISAPVDITSTPNTNAYVDEQYIYNIELNGTGPFTYSIDSGPTGMNIDNNGTVSWSPTAQDIGGNFVQITVENPSSEDTQAYNIEVVSLIDTDNDGVIDIEDNCPSISNPSQINTDGAADGGDACDDDDDNDGIADVDDAYPLVSVIGFLDTDGDGAPDECDTSCVSLGMAADNDDDNDGILDVDDAYPQDPTRWEETAFNVKHDVNRDGKADILWRNGEDGRNWLWTMDGLSILQSAGINIIADQAWQIVGRGDFNGDGKSDILWRNDNTGRNYMYLMDGFNIAEQGEVNYVTDSQWRVVEVTDMNGDGKDDIFWRHIGDGRTWIYLMDGMSITSSQGSLKISDQDWEVVASGDVNGDGKGDIIWRHRSRGDNYVWLMDGHEVASRYLLNRIAIGWTIVGTGDLNDDGTDDIVWRNENDGRNWAYLMADGQIAQSELINQIPDTQWKIVDISDVDGDGKADLFWRHGDTGKTYIYLMDGFDITARDYSRTIGSAWGVYD